MRPQFSACSFERTRLILHDKYIIRLRQNCMNFRPVFQSRGVISRLAWTAAPLWLSIRQIPITPGDSHRPPITIKQTGSKGHGGGEIGCGTGPAADPRSSENRPESTANKNNF
jgi:hypothetical protein